MASTIIRREGAQLSKLNILLDFFEELTALNNEANTIKGYAVTGTNLEGFEKEPKDNSDALLDALDLAPLDVLLQFAEIVGLKIVKKEIPIDKHNVWAICQISIALFARPEKSLSVETKKKLKHLYKYFHNFDEEHRGLIKEFIPQPFAETI